MSFWFCLISSFAKLIPKHLVLLIKSNKSPLAIFSLWFCSNDVLTTLKGFRISSFEETILWSKGLFRINAAQLIYVLLSFYFLEVLKILIRFKVFPVFFLFSLNIFPSKGSTSFAIPFHKVLQLPIWIIILLL